MTDARTAAMSTAQAHAHIDELIFPEPQGHDYANDHKDIIATFIGLGVASVVIVALILAILL